MFAIFKKDFFSLFNNVVGFVFIALNLAFYGLYFMASNLISGSPSISSALGGQLLILLITVPLLTMRSFSEERKNKTDILLLTSPVSIPKMILGKYLAMVAAFSLNVFAMGLTPIYLSRFGEIAWKESYVSLLGFWLFGCTCIAIGMFVSALFENQVIAAILTIGILVIGYIMSSVTGTIGSSTLISKILSIYDLTTPYGEFASGVIYVRSLVYYLSIIFLMLFLSGEVLLKRRWTISVARIKTSAFSVTSILLAIAITVGMNLGVNYLPDIYQTIDLTPEKFFSLTDETKEYLEDFTTEVNIYAMVTEENCDTAIHQTLSYFDQVESISVRYIDPELNPTFASAFTEDGVSEGELIVENLENGNVRIIDYYELYSNDYDEYTLYNYMMSTGYDYDSIYLQTATGYDGEGQLVSALQYVSQEELQKVYTLTGHEESSLGNAVSSYITKHNMMQQDLDLRRDEIPEDCTLLIINGAITDLGTDEISAIQTYLNEGGNAIIALNPDAFMNGNDPTPNLFGLLEVFGITPEYGILQEEDPNYTAASNAFLTYPDLNMDATLLQGIQEKPSILVPYAVPFHVSEDVASIELFSSSQNYSLVGVEEATGIELETENENENSVDDAENEESADETSPLTLGAMISTTDSSEYNLIVLSSAYMFVDAVEQIAPGMNSSLFHNILSIYENQDSENDLIVIPTKEFNATTLQFTSLQVTVVSILWIAVIPLLLLIFGITVWAVRRRR